MASGGAGATVTDEGAVQQLVRLKAAQLGNTHLFRNNVGVARSEDGERPVRYGLANDSPQLNKKLKSADLIGWRTIVIQPHHVGGKLAQFVSVECKRADWKFSLTRDRDQAQLAWLMLVSEAGGYAVFATGPDALSY
jgi:hypothetical protein